MSSSQSDDGVPNDRQISRSRFQSRDSLNSNSSSISSGNYPPKATEVSALTSTNIGKSKRKTNNLFEDRKLVKANNSFKGSVSNLNGLVKPSCPEKPEFKSESRCHNHHNNYNKFTSKVVSKNAAKFSHNNVAGVVKPKNVAHLQSKMVKHNIEYNNAHKSKDKILRKNVNNALEDKSVSFNVLQKSSPQNKLNVNHLLGSKKTISLVESPAFLDQITSSKRPLDRNKNKKDKKRKISNTKSEESLFSDAKNSTSLLINESDKKSRDFFDSCKIEHSSLKQNFAKNAEERLKPITSSSNTDPKFSSFDALTNKLSCTVSSIPPEINNINTSTNVYYPDLQKPENLKSFVNSETKVNTYLNCIHAENLKVFTNHPKVEKEVEDFNSLVAKPSIKEFYNKNVTVGIKSEIEKEKVSIQIKNEPEFYDLTGLNESKEPQIVESLEITNEVKCDLDQIEVDSGIIAEEKKVGEQISDLEEENKEEISTHLSVDEPIEEVQPTYLEVLEKLKEEQLEKEKAKRKLVDEEYQKLLQEYLSKKYILVISVLYNFVQIMSCEK